MLTLNVEHNYICYYYKEFTTTSCFGPNVGHHLVVVRLTA